MSRTITKMPWIKIVDMKACQTNCQCVDKLKRLVVKPPLNIIDETFIKFEIKERKKEYDKCYSLKIT